MSTDNASDGQMVMRSGPPPTRSGISLDVCTSGLIKELRRGREEAALRFAVELDESGYTQHLLRRLLISSVEDHGLVNPDLPAQVMALYEMAQTLMAKKDDKQRAYRLPLVAMVITLARSMKHRAVDHALIAFYGDPQPPTIEPYHYDKHTYQGKREGSGWQEFWEEGTLLLNFATGELEENPERLADPYRSRAMAATMPKRRKTR